MRRQKRLLPASCAIDRANPLQLAHDAGSNLFCRLIGNYCDLLVGLNSQAHVDRIAGAGSKFRIESQYAELLVGLSGGEGHYPTFLAEATDSGRAGSVSAIIYLATFFRSPGFLNTSRRPAGHLPV